MTGNFMCNDTFVRIDSIGLANSTNQNLTHTAYNQTAFNYFTEQIANAVNVYYTPLLITLGTIGNLLSVFVFFRSKLRTQSTSQYLSALAVSDTVFLFELVPPWLNAIQVTGVFYEPGFCQVFVYISYVTCCLSAWLVVAFTVERFVAVLYPLQRNALCTVKRARYVILCLVTAALLVNIPVLCLAISSKNDCNIDEQFIVYAERFNVVDTVISFTMPLLIIVALNALIIMGVYRLERARQQLVREEARQQSDCARHARHMACPRSQQRVTMMLLLVSSVFVVLNMPAYAMRMIAYKYDVDADNRRWALALQQLALSFFNTNFGINFILYCLIGKNFRHSLRQALPLLRCQPRCREAKRRASTDNQARASSLSSTSVLPNESLKTGQVRVGPRAM